MKSLSQLFAQARRHHLEGRPEQAGQLCQRVVAADPRHAEAWHLLGVLAGTAGGNDRAVELFEKAVQAAPSHALAHTNLAVALRGLGRREEALTHLLKAVELAPDSLHAVRNCAALLAELERWPEAAPLFERWAALEPGNATIHQMLGDCYALQGLGARAAACYIKSLELNPDSIDVANKLGAWLVEENFRAPVLAFLCQVVERNPESAPAWANLGSVTKNLGDLNTALRCYDRALALQPSHANILWNRALCLLALGRLPEGWADYEYRWQSGALRQQRPFTQPRWDGGDPAGKTILVWLEQGLGDQIAFASMLPDLIRGGARLVVESDARLVTLLARSLPGVGVVASTETLDPRTQQPDIDFQIPAGSLPRWLRPSLGSFPRHRGYLVPDVGKADAWSERLAALGDGPKVGICWRSMVTQGVRSQHYARLSQWGPILTTRDARFVNLQYDRCDEELREAERRFGVRIHGWDDIDLRLDQEGVAALISSLDLVISAGTAVDQLAGALGTPAWVLTRGAGDWWSLGTDYCPWYPSVRPFRCGASDPWEPVIGKAGQELAELVKEGSWQRRVLAHPAMEMVQVPANAWDQRMLREGIFNLAAAEDKLCLARSIFLQGLLVLPAERVAERLAFARSASEQWERLARRYGMAAGELAVRCALSLPVPAVVGMETADQARENAGLFELEPLSKSELDEIHTAMAAVLDERILNPSAWEASV